MMIPREIDDAFAALRKHIDATAKQKTDAHERCEAEQRAKGLPAHHHVDDCANATMLLSTINLKLHAHVWKP